MSLPSKAIFYKNKKEICREFVNCGWSLNEDSILKVLRELEYPNDDVWDEVFLYGDIYTKNEVNSLLEIYEKLDEFWKTKFKKYIRERENYNYEESIVLPIIRKKLPNLISKEIISIQPMEKK